jgi:DNA (cytosine-5)-methyltransferase 1
MTQTDLKFIDLFAGIGGFHIALHNQGARCVFASEIDTFARQTYQNNISKLAPLDFDFNDDITKCNPANIPDFDILCAGFPCQPFSNAGQKKGFNEERENRGNMFFIIADIVKHKQPKVLFLENVRGLLNHDNGNTFETIKQIINDLGYKFYYQIVKASDYGLPQHRPRVYMIAIRNDIHDRPFIFPQKQKLPFTISDVFGGNCPKDIGFTLRVGGRGSKIDDRRNWEFYMVDGIVRRIGVAEAKKMMGLPDWYNFNVSDVQAMKQLGNSVAVNAIEAHAKQIIHYLNDKSDKVCVRVGHYEQYAMVV